MTPHENCLGEKYQEINEPQRTGIIQKWNVGDEIFLLRCECKQTITTLYHIVTEKYHCEV